MATGPPAADDAFDQHRPLLFTIAYEVLGSVADAEDVLQEGYLRWRDVGQGTGANPRAYLVRLVTRQALNHLRVAKARREEYIGAWLPEPVRTRPDVCEDAVLAESVSMAMLLVLETLNPAERAVFVLHDVFAYGHAEIAASIGKTEVAVRQIAHRAREHVHARRRRFEPDTDATRRVVRRFLRPTATGGVQTLMDLMAPDVVVLSDGGGKAVAARRPITGREDVAGFVLGVNRTAGEASVEFAAYNGLPAVRFLDGDVARLAARLRSPRRPRHRPLRHSQPGQAAPRRDGAPAHPRRRFTVETMTVERVIPAPADDVFAWLTTTTNYTASPLALRCRLTRPGDGAPYGVGAVRVHLWVIGWFRERITRYEPPHVTEYVVDRSFPPSRHELGRMTFTEVAGGTHVEWTTRAELPIPLVGALLTRVLARPLITRVFRKVLDAAEAALACGTRE